MEDRKYVTTKKAKAKADALAQQILTQSGYNAVKAKVAPTPKPTVKPKVNAATIKKGEAAFIKELESGKTFEEARKSIIKQYGFWPNGRTN